MQSVARRMGTVLALAGLTLCSSGCFKTRVVVRVNPDGSGELLVGNLMSRGMIAQMEKQMEQMAAQMRAMGAEAPTRKPIQETMVSERLLRHLAPIYGEVEFVAARPLEQEGYVGAVAQYRFKDVRKIWVPFGNQQGQAMGAMMSTGEEAELPPVESQRDEKASIAFDWAPAAAGGGKLTVQMPKLPEREIEDDPNWELPKESDLTRQIAMQGEELAQTLGIKPGMTHEEVLKQLFGGIEMRIEVQMAGTVKSTTAQYPAEGRKNAFTVFLMDFGKILNSRKGLRLFSEGNAMGGDVPPLIKGVPGIEIEQGEVVFEIAP